MISFRATSKLRHDSVRGRPSGKGVDDVVVDVASDDAEGESNVASLSSMGFVT